MSSYRPYRSTAGGDVLYHDWDRDLRERLVWLYGEVRSDPEDIKAWRELGKPKGGPSVCG